MAFRLSNAVCLAALFVASASIALPTTAHAQSKTEIDTARTLMDEGDAQAEKGDFRGALRSYRAAHTIMNVPTTGIEVARMEAKLGSLVEARRMALAIVNMPAKGREPKPFVEARADAKQLADELTPRIPQLTIVLKGALERAAVEVKIDGRVIPSGEVRSPRDVDPGKHLVSVAKRGSEPEIQSVTIEESEKVSLEFDGATAPIVSDKPTRRTSPLVYVGFGLGGVGLIAGAVTGAMSLSRAGDVEALCPGGACPSQAALDDAKPINDSAFTLANVSNVAIGLGVVGIGLGVTGLVLSRSAPKKPEDTSAFRVFVGPNGAMVTGSF